MPRALLRAMRQSPAEEVLRLRNSLSNLQEYNQKLASAIDKEDAKIVFTTIGHIAQQHGSFGRCVLSPQ